MWGYNIGVNIGIMEKKMEVLNSRRILQKLCTVLV